MSSNEYGAEDKRTFCRGLMDCDTFRPAYCGLPASELRCKECWERKYRKAKKEQSSFTAEDISEPSLIAGRYTLAELTVPNRKAVRA